MPAPEKTDDSLVITLFGPMKVLMNGHPLPHMRSRKGLWLLALLTLRHDRPVEREWLAGTLWPDVDQSQAFANLRPILSELRNRMGSQSKRLQSPDRHTLRLDLSGAEVDLLAFDIAIVSNKRTTLEQAAALYQGPLLEGCLEEWVFQERALREQNCLQALQSLADTALTEGNYNAAIGYCQRAVKLDPWSDRARRVWMEALAKSGNRNTALQIYREFVELLRNDPNATPDEQTSMLYARLRAEARQQSSAQAVVVTQPAIVRKVVGYLPSALTDLIGREDEWLEVANRLRRSRLVTLTGMGGIGKTRLALEVAGKVINEYADGVWLVALDALAEGKQVLPQIASALGLKEEAGRPLQESVSQYLQTKRLLLVLDNCEHLLEASTQIVGHLLRACGELRILATSREALEITGETAWTVPSLAVPDPAYLPSGQATLLRVVMGYEGVQLFVERAQAVQKTFDLTADNARAVAQVCFRLDGIPLAIELAAARIKAMTVEQIATRLDDYLSLLTSGDRSAQKRQQTLRAALDWSYALLNEGERLLFRRLAVFAGGWSLAAIEGIGVGASMESWQVLNMLTSLVDKSLVMFEEREDSGRYRLLEMVRQYAGERLLASGEAEQIKTRHRDWFLALAEEAEPQLQGVEQVRWLQRLDTEYDNLRAALAICQAEEQGAEADLRLVGALSRFWYVRGHYSEGRKFFVKALEREEAQLRTAVRAKALQGAGTLAIIQGEYASARVLYEESLSIRRELGDKQGIAVETSNLGRVAQGQGEYASAQTLCEESLGLYRELGNKHGIATALNNLGNVAYSQGEYASARALYEENLSIRRELENKHGIATALNNLGNVAYDQGEHASARALYEESLSLARELGNKQGIASVLNNLGNVAYGQGDYASARTLYEESLSLYRELGDRLSVALATNNLGKVALGLYEYASAQTLCEESLGLYRELENKHGIANALHSLGNVAHGQGKHTSARALYEESLRIRRGLKEKQGVEENLEQLAIVMQPQTEAPIAARLWGAVHALRASMGMSQPSEEKAKDDPRVRQARSVLGEEAFAAAWEEGYGMTWEQAVQCALTEVF